MKPLIGFPRQWKPESMKGLNGFWTTEDEWVTTATGVSQWSNRQTDDYGYARFVQGTGTDQPALEAGYFPSGRDAIQGDGSDDLLAFSSAITLAPPYVVALGLETSTLSLQDEHLVASASAENIHIQTTGRMRVRTTTATTSLTAVSTFADDTVMRIIVACDKDGVYSVYLNGSDVTVAGPPTNTGNLTVGHIGCQTDGVNHHDAAYGVIMLIQDSYTLEESQGLVTEIDSWMDEYLNGGG